MSDHAPRAELNTHSSSNAAYGGSASRNRRCKTLLVRVSEAHQSDARSVQHEGCEWFKGVTHGVAQSVQAKLLQRREGEFWGKSQLQDSGNIMKALYAHINARCTEGKKLQRS